MAFSFPLLKKKEILSCLSGLGIPLTLEQLQKPDERIMKPIYERFVEVLMGITKDELRQPAFHAIDQLPYPELHEESISEITLQKSFLFLVRSVGIVDVSLRDLMYPTEKRLITLLSGLINFAKFREERLTVYQELNKQTEQIMELRQQLAFENETLQNTCKELTLQREAESDTLRSLISELSELESRLHATNTTHLQQHDALKLVKEKSQAVQDTLDSDKFVILNLKQECDKLKAAIVKSPEKLKQSISDMSASIESNKCELSESSLKFREFQSKHQHLTRIDTQIRVMIDTMQEVIGVKSSYKKLKREWNDQQAQITSHEEKIRAQQQIEAHLKKQLNVAQEKMVKLQMLFQTKKATAQATLDQMVREKHLCSTSLAADRSKLDHHEAEYAVKKAELDEIIQTHQQEMTHMRNLYAKFEQTLRSYHQRLLSEMAASSSPAPTSSTVPSTSTSTSTSHPLDGASADSPRQQQALEDAMASLNVSMNTSNISILV